MENIRVLSRNIILNQLMQIPDLKWLIFPIVLRKWLNFSKVKEKEKYRAQEIDIIG